MKPTMAADDSGREVPQTSHERAGATATTLRLGVLGAAGIAPDSVIKPARRRDDVEVIAVASRRLAAAEHFARTHDIPCWYGSYDALLVDPRVDAVYVALPPSEHAEWSIKALRAGKHVLCEKPSAMNAAQAAQMVAVARETGLRLVEGFHDRHHPVADRIIALIREGRLGRIESATATLVAPIPFRGGSIRHDPRLGGGALMDLGCYPVHWVRSVLGEEPRVVKARAELNELGADQTIEAWLAFPSGATGRVVASMDVDTFAATLEVHGSEGSLIARNLLHPHKGHSVTVTVGGVDRTFTVGGDESYDHQLAAFVSAVVDGLPVTTEGDDLVATMSLIDAIYVAAGVRE